MFHIHRFNPQVLFEAVRLKGTEGTKPTGQRYVVAQGEICRCGAKRVDCFNVLGRKTKFYNLPQASRHAISQWFAGEDLVNILYFGRMQGHIGAEVKNPEPAPAPEEAQPTAEEPPM